MKTDEKLIRVSAVVLHNSRGEILTVRKSGTQRFMLPGGKPEPGETPVATALREVAEEIGVELNPAELRHLGSFRAPAANEAGYDVEGIAFSHPAPATVQIANEIAEVRWLTPDPAQWPADLAPLLSTKILPYFLAHS